MEWNLSTRQTKTRRILEPTPYFKMTKNHLAPFFTCKTLGKRQTKRDHPQARNKSTARRRKMDGDSHPSIHRPPALAKERVRETENQERGDRSHPSPPKRNRNSRMRTRTHTRGGGGWRGLKEALNYIRLKLTMYNKHPSCMRNIQSCMQNNLGQKVRTPHNICNPHR